MVLSLALRRVQDQVECVLALLERGADPNQILELPLAPFAQMLERVGIVNCGAAFSAREKGQR